MFTSGPANIILLQALLFLITVTCLCPVPLGAVVTLLEESGKSFKVALESRSVSFVLESFSFHNARK